MKEIPHGLSAISTHDTKFSEDVCARINVLSEIPDEWELAILRWHHLTESARFEPKADSPRFVRRRGSMSFPFKRISQSRCLRSRLTGNTGSGRSGRASK
jgi:maltooligosyltrehalose synthase